MINNDKKEFSKLYKTWKPQIFGYIRKKIDDYETVEDITQDVFLQIWQFAEKHPIQNVRGFLYKTAYNRVVDYYRKKYKRKEIFLSLDINFDDLPHWQTLTAEEALDRKPSELRMEVTLSCLSGKHRKIIIFRFIENMTIDEISDATGKSPNYVSVLIYQGIRQLRENPGCKNGLNQQTGEKRYWYEKKNHS